MSQEHEGHGRPELPIERGFPIERVNEIAEKEGRAKQWYRPIYTMHKWWARRPGCLFRAIMLYSLLDENTNTDDVEVFEPGTNETLGANGLTAKDIVEAIGEVSMDDPEPLWQFYPKDVRIRNKKILDPFMGGGTSVVEASRFGVESHGVDLNPVAWFVTKKQLEAGQTDIEELDQAFEQVKDDVSEEILQYYRTPCPNADHEHGDGHDADVMYNFWVKELDCVSCGHTVPLFKDYRVAAGRYENGDKYNVLCPDCGAITLVDDWQEDSRCTECDNEFVPKDGNVSRGGYYTCPDCGQKESITEAIADQGKAETRMYALEYYCEHCDTQGLEKSAYKGYKRAEPADKRLYAEAERTWNARTDLHEYVPDEEIPEGAKTAASSVDGSDVFQHGLEKWTDMFNERQLLCLSTLLQSIEKISEQNAREYLLLAFSEALNFNTMMVPYQAARNHTTNLFKSNSFDPPQAPSEGNLWGTEYGIGRFRSTYEMIRKGVEYAQSPTDRYFEDGTTKETQGFAQKVGENSEISQRDMRHIDAESEYDAVITDPPYYDNIIYSELSDYFYVWQKILLEDEYPGFDREQTPRAESIVTNPFLDKTAEDFEHEMGEALAVINRSLKDDGTLVFTYHHSDEESWGELLESLCNNGFEVTTTYPINSDLAKFIGGESVAFDIVIVARPSDDQTPISWRQLRIDILNRLDTIQQNLEARDLTEGDIGVIEMGACFAEYSKHHGEVRRSGEIMTAKQAVSEIYGIIQEGALGEQDIFLDLLRTRDPTFNDLNKLLRKSDASEEEFREKALFRMEGNEFHLGDWRDTERQAYVVEKIENGEADVTPLEQAHFLRYRFEEGRSTSEYRERWEDDDLRDLCEGLAEITGDETYLKMLGSDIDLDEFQDD